MKRKLFILASYFLFLFTIMFFEFIDVKNIKNSFEKSIDNIVISSIYYSLEKEDVFYISKIDFEKTILNLIEVVLTNYDVKKCVFEIGYIFENYYIKGVVICLKYKIKNYQLQINSEYMMNQ